MTSNRPYLIRAIYDWVVENGLTPHIVFNAGHPSAQLPQQYVSGGKLVVNIAPRAVSDLVLGNDLISFSARFQGRPMFVSAVPEAVLAIYARENGEGMVFPETDGGDDLGGSSSEPPAGKPSLKIVK